MNVEKVATNGFSIYDSRDQVAFDLDAKSQTYEFFNETLALEVQQGIAIPPMARRKFEGQALVHPTSAAFDLFERAMRHLFETELAKDGFRLMEKV